MLERRLVFIRDTVFAVEPPLRDRLGMIPQSSLPRPSAPATTPLLAAEEGRGEASPQVGAPASVSSASSPSTRRWRSESSDDESDYSRQAGAQETGLNLTPTYRWVAGAAGAGLIQASMALSARADAGAATIGTAGTAMGLGVWLYGHGVRRVFLDAIEGLEPAAVAEGLVATVGCVGSAAGVALAAVPMAPARVAGVGLVAVSTAAFHHTLARSYVRDEIAFGQLGALQGTIWPETSWRDVAAWSASGCIVAAALVVASTTAVEAAEAAAAALFCHAIVGTTLATYSATNRWRRGQAETSAAC